jgi:hypothetical protein
MFTPLLLVEPTAPDVQIAQNRDRNSPGASHWPSPRRPGRHRCAAAGKTRPSPPCSGIAMLTPGCWQKASSRAGAVTVQNNTFSDGCGRGRPAPATHSDPVGQPWCSRVKQVEQRGVAELLAGDGQGPLHAGQGVRRTLRAGAGGRGIQAGKQGVWKLQGGTHHNQATLCASCCASALAPSKHFHAEQPRGISVRGTRRPGWIPPGDHR